MRNKQLVGQTVTFYLVGGHKLTATVKSCDDRIELLNTHRSLDMHDCLVVILNGHTTFIRADQVCAFEVH